MTKVYDGGHSVSVNDGPASAERPPLGKMIAYAEGATVEVKPQTEPPSAATGRYRSDHQYLFQHVDRVNEPDRIHQGDSKPWVLDGAGTPGQIRCQPVGGPSGVADHIDYLIGWAFDSKGKGGDIIDRFQNRNPATPIHWLQTPVNAVPSGAKQYTIDATDAVRFIQQQNRWNAWSFNRSGAPRQIAGKAHAQAPRFVVAYTDGTTETLACRVTAMMSTSTAYPFTLLNQAGLPQFDLPIVAEFERPRATPVASASFMFYIDKHTSSKATFVGNVLDPPLNTNPVKQGLAQQAGPLDAGLANVPGMIYAHQYLDTLPDSEWFDWTGPQNTDDEKNFSPEIIWSEHTGNPVAGPYVPDLTKYPHRSSPVGGKHKWCGLTPAQAAAQFYRVPSTYDKEGFEALAPGVGAVRSFNPHLPGIKDGTIETSASWQTILAWIFLDAQRMGISNLFTRYYLRLGTPTHTGDPLGVPAIPYRMPIAERYQVFNSSGHWIFTDCHGKTGVVPTAHGGYGGFSGTSGGGGGWQMRQSFGDFDSAVDGPDVGGLALGWHHYDFGARNPPGYQYNGDGGALTQFGQQGGVGGILYGQTWVCVETQVKLNDVRDSKGNVIPALAENGMFGGFIPNGEVRVWWDGRLVMERVGMVMRALHSNAQPYSYGGSKWGSMSFVDPGYNKALRRQCRDIGIMALICNEYHGGVTQNNINRSRFYSQLAWSQQYIGPMRLQ